MLLVSPPPRNTSHSLWKPSLHALCSPSKATSLPLPPRQHTHNGSTPSLSPKQADNLLEELRQLEAKCSEANEARATAEGHLEQQRTRAEESLARVAAAEEKAQAHAAARAEAEERAALATDALERAGAAGAGARAEGEKEDEEGGAVDGRVAAAEAAAEEARSELSRLKKAFREERKENEAMLLESRYVCVRLFLCFEYTRADGPRG